MSLPWLLRWSPVTEPEPVVLLPLEENKDLSYFKDADLFILFHGYLFDRTNYLADSNAPPAVCIAQAYRRYGDDLFDYIRGGFAVVIWDRACSKVVAGRDHMGLHPFYYYWEQGLLIISCDIDLILAQPEVPADFNRVRVVEHLHNIHNSYQCSETFYTYVRRLPSAHRLCLSGKSFSVSRYWDPLPPDFPWATEKELRTFLPLLEQAIGRCLDVGADCIALSGGFDSVSIASVATTLHKGKKPLHAITLRFDAGDGDEWETQSAVACRMGMPQLSLKVSEYVKKKQMVCSSLELSGNNPFPLLGLYQFIYRDLFKKASSTGLHKMLMGTGGDEMYIVDVHYGADRIAALDLKELWQFYRASANTWSSTPVHIARTVFWTFGAKILLKEFFRSTLEALSPGLARAVRRRHLALKPSLTPPDPIIKEAVWNRRIEPGLPDMFPGEGRYIRSLRRLTQSPSLMDQSDRTHKWVRESGLSMLYPYFDRDLAELSLRMHPKQLLASGHEKTPLRQLVADQLSDIPLPNRKVIFSLPYNAIFREQGVQVWREMGGVHRLEELGVVDPRKITPIIEGYFSGQNQQMDFVWTVINAENWLRMRTS